MKRGIPIFLILIFLYSINCQNTSVSNVANYTDKKYIALTFDDGPSKVYTPKLLDGLKKRNVKATFFILGLQANSYPNIVKRIQDEGHVIGNHTYHHYNLSRLNSQKAEKEINDTSNLIYSITGFFPKYFRPSYGSIRKKQIESIDLKMIRWTLDSKDWKYQNTKKIVNKVLKDVSGNEIILMHDIYKSSVDAALIIIDKLQKEGYEFVDINKYLSINS